jgi:hypothetical protein
MSQSTQPAAAPQPSKADAFVVSCIDPRLTDDTTYLLATLGRTNRYSEMRIAGAALAAVDENRPGWNTALWENLAASRQLHGVKQVVFINHRDCGAMNLWAGRRLGDDPAEELRVHHQVMERAAAAVRQRHPDMTVELRLMELDGSARLLPCAACGTDGGLRAEAVAPPAAAPTAETPRAYAELVRLRTEGGLPHADAERELLAEGVTRYGMTADGARAALEAEVARRGGRSASAGAREVGAYLRSQADRGGRVARQDVDHAVALYRGLVGGGVSQAEAGRAVAALVEAEGLSPKPQGLLRTTTWYRRMAEA